MPVIVGGTIIEGGPPQSISGAGAPVNGTDEIQTITIGGTPEVGSTFRLTFDGWKTAPIAWSSVTNTLIAAIDAALEALPNIGTSGVTTADGTSTLGVGTFTVTFVAQNGKINQPLMVGSEFKQSTGAASTGTVSVATTTPGVTATGYGSAPGTIYTNVSNGVEYLNTGTAIAPTWTTVDVTLAAALLTATPGTVVASKAVIVDSGKVVNEWSVTGALTVIGTITATTGDVSIAKTVTSATPATDRLVRSELTLTPSGASLAVGSSGSLAAVRGAITLTTGKELTDGFAYGVQGKFIGDGATISVGSGHVAGVYAQISGSGMTVTDGHVAGLIVSGQTLPASDNVDAVYLESGGNKIHSALKSNVAADYLFDIANFENCGIVAAAGTGGGSAGASGGAVATRVLKVMVDGVAAYIPLCSTNA